MSAAVRCPRHGLETLSAKSGQREQARAELSTARRGIDCWRVIPHLDKYIKHENSDFYSDFSCYHIPYD